MFTWKSYICNTRYSHVGPVNTCILLTGFSFFPQDGTVRMSWLLASLTHVRTMVFVTIHLIMKGLLAVVHQAGKVL